jgi:hypothetical protein
VIAALQECGALPPLSPVPGQLATLCARLNVAGHGISTPAGCDLPESWLSVLTQYQQTETRPAPVRDGCAAAAVVLPELDGIQLTILGLHNCADSSILHMHACGPACHTAYGPNELYSCPLIWICDSGGRWHATRTSGQSGRDGEIALRLWRADGPQVQEPGTGTIGDQARRRLQERPPGVVAWPLVCTICASALSRRCPGRSLLRACDGVHPPLPGYARQFLDAVVVEGDSGTGDQVFYRL